MRNQNPLRTIKLTLAYDGGAYAGWQEQRSQPTLQQALEQAIRRITGETLRVVASGRTDAGVHALGQVVSFDTESQLPAESFYRALNAELPADISVNEAIEVRHGFHAIRDAVRKRYRYVIDDGPVPDVFRRKYAWRVRKRIDAEAMQRAAGALVGTHDFRSFESAWPNRESSVRTVHALTVTRSTTEPHLILIEIEANGFLYNMVRAIVGTLVEVGRGVQPEHWPGDALAALNRQAAGPTAPPHGLYLVRVDYDGREQVAAPSANAPIENTAGD